MKSAIILAGGRSSRFGKDKGLLSLGGKTLVEHVREKMAGIAREVVITVSTKAQEEIYSRMFSSCFVATDDRFHGGPLAGLYTGLKVVNGNKVAVVGCDMPFVSGDLLDLLFELCQGHDAVIPRWPNGYVEPFHSVYDTSHCLSATERALRMGRVDMRSMISNLRDITYFSTEAIRQMHVDLTMFVNINTRSDLEKARHIFFAHGSRRCQ